MTRKNIARLFDFSKEDNKRDKEIAKMHKMCVRIIKRRLKKEELK